MPSRPPEYPDLAWRPATEADVATLASLHRRCYDMDGGYFMVAEEFRAELRGEDLDPAFDTIMGFDRTGNVAAFGSLHIPGGERTQRRCFPRGFVHPDHRRRGVGTALMLWLEGRGRERLAGYGDGLPAVYRVDAYDFQPDKIALFERLGYTTARYFTEMLCPLPVETRETTPPEGIEIRVWSDDVNEAARVVHNHAFSDHWGSQPVTSHAWDLYHDEFFLPSASFVAFDGGEAVGYLTASTYPHDYEVRIRKEGWIESLGVVRSHRGRGIATALLDRTMAVFNEMGLTHAALGVDTENPTGAFGLYTRLGFTVDKRSITMVKDAPVDRTNRNP
jgi:mycothiol synthase